MSKEKNTQSLDVLKHLRKSKKKGLTSMEAFNLYGITRLSAKIFDLNRKGYVIECIREKGLDRHGHTCSYGRYVLVSEPEQKSGE